VPIGQLALGLRLQVSARNVQCPGDDAGIEFMLLAHVHQRGRGPGVEASFQRVQRDCPDSFPHLSEQVGVAFGHWIVNSFNFRWDG